MQEQEINCPNNNDVLNVEANTELKKMHKIGKILVFILFVVLILSMGIWGMRLRESKSKGNNNNIMISVGNASDYLGENSDEVIKTLEELGFTNIRFKDADDVHDKEDIVGSISINGKENFDESEHYNSNAMIVINCR